VARHALAVCRGAARIAHRQSERLGQINLGLPVAGQMSDLQATQLALRDAFAAFLSGQVFMMGPAVLLALAGAALLFARTSAHVARGGVACATAVLLLLVLRGKPYYAGRSIRCCSPPARWRHEYATDAARAPSRGQHWRR
jgi:hypothetical protein